MQWAYLVSLIVAIACMGLIDRRYKLALWRDRHRTIATLAVAVGIFIVWDILGIGLKIFFHGNSSYSLPFTILPEFPIEELFFLTLLCYTTLIIYLGASKR
ncbi:MAG: hypothetical protein QG549_602 [Patescibacteria group bacterium]|jgi:lycopene cyclase domain-containing protein|nr:hypothetical protein [Patescibacteria group bacterium]